MVEIVLMSVIGGGDGEDEEPTDGGCVIDFDVWCIRARHDGVMINSWNVSCAVNTLTFKLKTDVRMKT